MTLCLCVYEGVFNDFCLKLLLGLSVAMAFNTFCLFIDGIIRSSQQPHICPEHSNSGKRHSIANAQVISFMMEQNSIYIFSSEDYGRLKAVRHNLIDFAFLVIRVNVTVRQSIKVDVFKSTEIILKRCCQFCISGRCCCLGRS